MTIKIDEKTFFDGYRSSFGKLNQSTVEGLQAFAKEITIDQDILYLRWAAYIMATVHHETGREWLPITEYGRKSYFDKYNAGTVLGKRLGNVRSGDGYNFRGRGYVQITGRANYARMSLLLDLPPEKNLVKYPDKTLLPSVAYQVLSKGMLLGTFTGRTLSDYIAPDTCDYKGARAIVNGSDQNKLIAGYADIFETIIRESIL